MTRQIVLGVDSSTQSTKVIAVDVYSGETVANGRASHSGEDIQDPAMWWEALGLATGEVLSPDVDVLALSVAAQQHGLVTLDGAGNLVRPAPLWNNTESAPEAQRLNEQADFASLVGSRLVASFTITKLAHMARTYPDDLARTASVCLPHDWLTFKLTGNLTTDRGDASGTGWWSPVESRMMPDLIELAVGIETAHRLQFPQVLSASEIAGKLSVDAAEFLGLPHGLPVATGTGDNMGAALGIGARLGEIVISLGTSGTAYAVSDHPSMEPAGVVAGFADATGNFMPLVCMLNCTRVVDGIAGFVGMDTSQGLDLAGEIRPGADGLLLIPYLAGERTPNLPNSTGELLGLTYGNATAGPIIRAAVDGVAAGLAMCVEALEAVGVRAPKLVLVGGGSQHPTWQQAIADATGLPVEVRAGGEHVARGAAIQAAASVRVESVQDLARLWRPPVVAEAMPRPGMREAFHIERRREWIESRLESG